MQAAVRGHADSLGSLAFLWALAILYHELAYRLLEPSIGDVLLIGLALGVLLAPGSLALFGSLLVVQLAEFWHRLPLVANHWFFEAIVALTLAAALAGELRRSGGGFRAIDRERLFADIAPVLRLEMLLLYAIAAFHKLNRDYLDPQQSCAVYIHRLIAARVPFYPSGPWVEEMTIPISLLIEAGLPLLLLIPRTRLVGLAIGALFHLGLSRSPFPPGTFSFGGMLLSFYALFLPAEAWAWIGARLVGSTWVRAAVALAAGLTLLATRLGRFDAGLILYAAEALAFVALLLSRRMGSLPREAASRLLRLPSPALVVFPALVLMNGLSPYLGLKTQTAFSMFSNLRTEGGATNHLLITRPLALGYQEDLVTIVSSSDSSLQWYAKRGFRIAWFEFRDYASRHPELSVRYERRGSEHDVGRAGDETDLSVPTPYLQRKLLFFRPAKVDGPVPCEH